MKVDLSCGVTLAVLFVIGAVLYSEVLRVHDRLHEMEAQIEWYSQTVTNAESHYNVIKNELSEINDSLNQEEIW